MNIKDIIVKKVNSLYNDYQTYANFFDEERQKVEKEKKDIAKSIEKGKSFEEFETEMEFLLFGYQIKMQDVNSIVQELVTVYSLALSAELKEEFEEELIEKVEKLKESKRKLTFVPTEKGLEERVKGTQEKAIKEAKDSPQYGAIMKMLTDNLKN